jgi:multicomponent Na+:H+ antiporter subunit B
MSLIVKRITRLSASLIFLYGVYIVLHGHLTPGGGFAGGVIIALSFIHLVLAFGKAAVFRRAGEAAVSLFESLGALLFLGIALVGLGCGGYFFLNVLPKGRPFTLFSSGIIILSNIAICIKVGAGLLAVFLALAFLRLPPHDREDV